MDLTDDDIQAAYFLAHRFVDPMHAAGRTVNDAIRNFTRKVDLAWDMHASGTESQDGSAQSEASYTVAEAAAEMTVTQGYVRRLARRGDLSGAEKPGRDWLIPRQAVTDYLETRSGRAA